MGGYGSGRPGRRVSIEGLRTLDIRVLRRRGALDSAWSGNWTWRQYGESCGSIGHRMLDGAIELSYSVSSDGGTPEQVRIHVPIWSVPCRFGGERRYFGCPHCLRRCEVIVMTTNGRAWGCRKCLPLRYASQALSPAWRIQERANALYARAGTDYGEGMVAKRKWMRWRTYHRLMARANHLDRLADPTFAARCMQRLGMGPDDLLEAFGVRE